MGEKDLVLRNESVKGIDAGNESVHVKERRFDVKGKGIVNHGPKSCARQRRVSCLDPSCGDGESHPSTNHNGNKAIECSSLPVDSGADADHFHDDDETPSITNFVENAIKMLEQALEQKHTAYAALFLELEKERNAAASTTDEAIAMVLCLQEKMASVEMEARQYKRIIEEKSSYDAEEMNILKEILVRRELEKHFLEKRVDAYSSRKHKFSENAVYLESEEQEKNSSASQDEEKGSKSSGDMISAMEAHVHDIHVRDGYKDKETLWEGHASIVHRESDLQLGSSKVEKIDGISDFPSANGLGMEPNFSRSSTNTTAWLPLLGGSSHKYIISNLWKNSMSPVDNEGLKIYLGVEWLREKFRIVQE